MRNVRINFFWHLGLMWVGGKIPSVDGRLFGMVMRADFLRLLFIFDSDCLEKMTGEKMEIEVMIKMGDYKGAMLLEEVVVPVWW